MEDENRSEDGDKSMLHYGKKLSISFIDKDEKENAKFNDARLVDILRNYPLLYNKSLESYGDPDYTQWMWGEIATEMNEPHRKTTLNFPFNWINCRDQWEVVKRVLRYLSNPAAKSFRYPKHFRECLQFFQNYIKDRREPQHTDRSQDLFINHANLLEQLPFEKQLALEKEILDVILSNELEFCAPMVDPQAVEAEASAEFAKVIGVLMPELDLSIVKNELSTETDTFVIEELVEKVEDTNPTTENENVIDMTQMMNLYAKSGIKLKRQGQIDLDSLLQIPSKRMEIIVPQLAQYSAQEVAQEVALQEVAIREGVLQKSSHQEGGLQQVVLRRNVLRKSAIQPGTSIQNVIVNSVMHENTMQEVAVADGSAQEVVIQECVFQEDAMQEDLIEEVVPQGAGKDMPSLDMDGQFGVHGNEDFSSVLNEILK